MCFFHYWMLGVVLCFGSCDLAQFLHGMCYFVGGFPSAVLFFLLLLPSPPHYFFSVLVHLVLLFFLYFLLRQFPLSSLFPRPWQLLHLASPMFVCLMFLSRCLSVQYLSLIVGLSLYIHVQSVLEFGVWFHLGFVVRGIGRFLFLFNSMLGFRSCVCYCVTFCTSCVLLGVFFVAFHAVSGFSLFFIP